MNYSVVRCTVNFSDATGMLACWLLRSFEYEFELVHRDGMKRQSYQALSGLFTANVGKDELVDEIAVVVLIITKT